MRRISAVALVLLATLVLTGCGSSTVEPGKSEAAAACKTSGVRAAALAAHAAAVNPKFAVLSVDEGALAASEANQEGELSDGSGSDDSGLGALSGALAIGSTADNKVLSDCVALGLPIVSTN
jgi:hypothetical protein